MEPIRMLAASAVVLLSATSCASQGGVDVVEYEMDYQSYSSIEQLCGDATLVVVASPERSEVREVNIAAEPDDSEVGNPSLGVEGGGSPEEYFIVETVTTLRISKVLKGRDIDSGSDLEMGQPGGRLGDIEYSAEQFDLVDGEQYLLFLAEFPKVPANLLNPTQAAYLLDADGRVKGEGSLIGTAVAVDSQLCTSA